MREGSPSASSRYAAAVAITAAAVGLRWLLDPWLGDRLALVTLFAAVAITEWFAGLGPALVMMAIGYLACDYLFIGPPGAIGLDTSGTALGLLAYLGSSLTILWFGETMLRARAKARQREALLSVTMASIGDAVITTDEAGRITYLNPVAESLTGWTMADASGRSLESIFRIVNEQTRETVENPVSSVLRKGVVVGLANHTVLIARDGTERPIDDSAAPIRDERGRIAGCVLVFRDVTDRRRAERALARSEQELADFFENASVGLHSVGPDGIVLRVNQAELDMLGYTREEYVGRPIAAFHVDQATIEGSLARLWRGETLRNEPGQMRCKDGSIRDVEISSSVLVEDGQFVHTRCFTTDVTDRKRAEEARTLLAAIVSASDDAIVSKTLDGSIRSWNHGAERLFGYSAAEAVGRSIDLIVPPELRDEERTILARLGRGERVDHFETVRVAKNGRRLNVSLTISPVRDEAGRVIGASKVARDITEQREAQAQLARLADELKLITDAMPALISYVDASGCYRFNNRAYADWFHQPRESIQGKHLRDVLGPAAYERIRPHVEAALAGRRVMFEDEIPYREGAHRYVHAEYVPDVDQNGSVRGFYALIADITQRKWAEETLREADRRKDEFLATLAHELRNPLAPIRNSLEILKRAGHDREALIQARDTIERQLSHMIRLVDDLLDVSRITRDRLELRKRRVELASIIHQAVETCRQLAERENLEIDLQLTEPTVHLDADPVRLTQVFSNLLNNACKYTQAGGSIRLRTERRGREVLVSVKDSGIGIPPEKLGGIFDMFSQVDTTLERSRGGLGIGLTLVKRLIELHGGNIEARSEGLGKGSEFIVCLPVVAEGPVEPDLETPAIEPQAARRRVLVVDDNRDSAESLAMLLSLSGHETQRAHDGLEAIEVAERFRPHVILLDIGLPKLNGLEVCRRIREQPWGRKLVLVALTGWGQEDDRLKSREAGFNSHIVKPVDPDDLLRLVDGLIPEEGGELTKG